MHHLSEVCESLNGHLRPEGKLFAERGEKGCRTTKNPERGFFSLGTNLQTLWDTLASLNGYRHNGIPAKAVSVQMIIAVFFSIMVSLTFGLAVRFGRFKKLQNEIDKFDESTIDRLKDRARNFFHQSGSDVDLHTWLVTANSDIRFLTPLEAIRYPIYRSALFDSLPIRAPKLPVTDGEVVPMIAVRR
jgi:hypothetical protein